MNQLAQAILALKTYDKLNEPQKYDLSAAGAYQMNKSRLKYYRETDEYRKILQANVETLILKNKSTI